MVLVIASCGTQRESTRILTHTHIFVLSYQTVLLLLIPVHGKIMCVSGCVFKQVHTSCCLIIATYLSHDFFTSETRIFCFHCKRKVCESHEVTISFSCTLTYTFAIISAQGTPWMQTQASFSIILRCFSVRRL